MKKNITFALTFLALTAVPFFAQAAQIYLDPATGKYPPGVTFGVDVRLDTQNQCINAAEVDLAYPANLLQAVAASDGDSIFSLWVKPPTIYANYGVVSFVGGLPGGYCGRVAGDPSLSNKLATIYFRFPTSTTASTGTPPQTAQLSFLTGTNAVVNDGQGTSAALTTAGAKYTQLLTGKFAPLNVWQNAIQNDATPPEAFTIGVYRDTSLFDDQWFAVFSTVDKQTGIDHYEVAEVPAQSVNTPQNQWNWTRAVSPYLIKDQNSKGVIAVRAIDQAGNARVEEYTMPQTSQPASPSMWFIPYLAIVSIVGFTLVQLIIKIF